MGCGAGKQAPVVEQQTHLTRFGERAYGKQTGIRQMTVKFTVPMNKAMENVQEFVMAPVKAGMDAIGMGSNPMKQLDDEATAAIPDNLEKYKELVRCVRLFDLMGDAEVEATAREMQIRHFKADDIIYDEGDVGHEAWILESGVCFASKYVWSTGTREYVKGRMKVVSNAKEWKETRQYKPGKFGSYFGERSLIRREPRNLRVTCRTDVKVCRISATTYVTCARIREYKEALIRKVRVFETMTDDQVGKLAALLNKCAYAGGATMLTKGEHSPNFMILETGDASGGGRTYKPGDIINEQVLLTDAAPEATVTAAGDAVAYVISRVDFEEKVGRLAKLQEEQYAADPRKLLSDFFQQGDPTGPAGCLAAAGLTRDESKPASSWFAVYRPCSRDSIAKMLGTTGVGKGLNVRQPASIPSTSGLL